MIRQLEEITTMLYCLEQEQVSRNYEAAIEDAQRAVAYATDFVRDAP